MKKAERRTKKEKLDFIEDGDLLIKLKDDETDHSRYLSNNYKDNNNKDYIHYSIFTNSS